MIGEISLRGATPIVMGILIATRYTRILDVTLLPFIQRHYPDGHHFQQDNDPKHTSSWQAHCEQKGINWWANLPSSPDLNPIENIWASVKQYLCTNVKPKNIEELKAGIPCVTAGTFYAYLSSHAGNESGEGTFKALTQGYTHWVSGHIDCLDINIQHPDYCYIQSVMKPSMKPGRLWWTLYLSSACMQHSSVLQGKCVTRENWRHWRILILDLFSLEALYTLTFLLIWRRFKVSICVPHCSLMSTPATGTVPTEWQSLHFQMYVAVLRETVEGFKHSLTTSDNAIYRIECETRQQQN